MEKRAILAFGLSFLVLLVWTMFTTPKQELPITNDEIEQTQEITPLGPDTLSMPAAGGTELKAAQPLSQILEKEIHIETPLYGVTLSSRNAAINPVLLPKASFARK